MVTNKETKRLTEKVRKLCDDGPFRPFAMYDTRLDRIYVVTKDCSVTEIRVNEILTLLENNYSTSEEEKYVGFIIERAQAFCSRYGLLTLNGEVKLADILDALMVAFPNDPVPVDILGSLLYRHSLNRVAIEANL